MTYASTKKCIFYVENAKHDPSPMLKQDPSQNVLKVEVANVLKAAQESIKGPLLLHSGPRIHDAPSMVHLALHGAATQ